jgi:hypothetical protein
MANTSASSHPPSAQTVFRGYTIEQLTGMLTVGDLVSLTLSKYRQGIWTNCGTEGWEDTWELWVEDGAPGDLSGAVSNQV